MLRGKERKNRYANLNRDKEDLCTLKINCKGKRTVRKQTKEYRKNNNRFKKFKFKKKERGKKKKENSTELQKPNTEEEVYNNNKNWGGKKAQ